jgi:hypothetical protein
VKPFPIFPMKLRKFFLLLGSLGLLLPVLQAQKATLGIVAINPIPSLAQAAGSDGRAPSLQRLAEVLDSQLVDQFNATRKFELVSRSDLKNVLDEQELANSGNVNAQGTNAAKQGRLEGAKYILTATIDEFSDNTRRLELPAAGKVLLKRTISLGTVAKIYDSTTGKLLESANHRVERVYDSSVLENVTGNGDAGEAELRNISQEMAGWLARRVADVIFPIKIIAKSDKVVTLNRGEGGSVNRGDEWRVFAVGKELIDPDTKEVLGKEEIQVGRVRITDVLPKTSRAEVLEDLGIEAGAILRSAK